MNLLLFLLTIFVNYSETKNITSVIAPPYKEKLIPKTKIVTELLKLPETNVFIISNEDSLKQVLLKLNNLSEGTIVISYNYLIPNAKAGFCIIENNMPIYIWIVKKVTKYRKICKGVFGCRYKPYTTSILEPYTIGSLDTKETNHGF